MLFRPAILLSLASRRFASLARPRHLAADDVKMEISLKGHVFTPSDLTVPAGKVVLLTVKNTDPTPEEFDSSDLRVEKVIAGGAKGVVRFGPLDPGKYKFKGEYNEATAHGVVTAE